MSALSAYLPTPPPPPEPRLTTEAERQAVRARLHRLEQQVGQVREAVGERLSPSPPPHRDDVAARLHAMAVRLSGMEGEHGG